MIRLRGLAGPPRQQRDITSGPGRLAQAFGLTLEHDGTSVLGPDLYLFQPAPSRRAAAAVVECGPRVGLGKGAELPYRFFLADNPFVSRWRPGTARRSSGGRPINRD